MRVRGAANLLLLALAACSGAPSQAPQSAKAERVACKVGGAAGFAPDCTVERAHKGGIETLVVRHPDGSFRRFDVLADGRGLAVADGATQAVTRYADGFAELAVDGDAYRFPITVKPAASHAATP